MKLRSDLCIGCGECVPVCPGEAIHLGNDEKGSAPGVARIDFEACLECQVCHRWGRCPVGAFEPEEELPWPRSLRRLFSDPLAVFSGTTVSGRGTEEMKTNDVSGRFPEGILGLSVDVGRPNAATYFRDVDRISRALAPTGARFAADNPMTELMANEATGALREDILGERVLSAVIEAVVTPAELPGALAALRDVTEEIDTIFSVGLIGRLGGAYDIRGLRDLAAASGMPPGEGAKINVGLGRPRAEI